MENMPITLRELRIKMQELMEQAANSNDERQANEHLRLTRLWATLQDRLLSGEQIYERPE